MSKILPSSSAVITLLLTLTISILIKNVNSTRRNYKELEILDDLPLKDDLEKYVTKLEKIVHFTQSHIRYTDLNLAFALFLADVNLRTVLKVKGQNIPKNILFRLKEALKTNDKIIAYFKSMVTTYKSRSESYDTNVLIVDLFAGNNESWATHLQKFRTGLLKKTKFYLKRDLVKTYSKWPQYVKKVNDFENYVPNPGFSDSCISSMSRNPVNYRLMWVPCNISPKCSKMSLNGTEYGYAITHRLLLLQMARFARGCTVISAVEDKKMIDNFCAKIYNEAEYLAYNDFGIPDLSMEQITLCTLEGHAQFLRRSWIDELFEFQTDLGCFGTSLKSKDRHLPPGIYQAERPKWEIIHQDQDIMEGTCNTHTTGVAAAMISAAIRYIVEQFY